MSAQLTYAQLAAKYHAATSTNPRIQASLDKIKKKIGEYSGIESKTYVEEFRAATLEYTGLTASELLGDDYTSGVSDLDLKVSSVLLKALLIYSKVFENNISDPATFVNAFKKLDTKYFAYIPFLLKENAKLTGQFLRISNNKNTKMLFLQGQILGNLILKTPNAFKHISDSQTRTFVKGLKKAYESPNATTELLLCVPQYRAAKITTLSNLMKALEEAVNTANLKNTNGMPQLAQKTAEYHSVMAEIDGARSLKKGTKGELITEIAAIIDNSNLTPIEKQLVQVIAAQDDILFEGKSPLAKALLLNEEQERALTSDKAVTYITAGAGSGKTRVLAGRVAHLLNTTGVTPFNIIATSFSKKSANELRSRVRSLAGEVSSGIDEIQNIESTLIGRTIHSVAREMLAMFKPSALKKKVIEEYDQLVLLQKAIELIKAPADAREENTNLQINAPARDSLLTISTEYTSLPQANRIKSLLALNLYNIANFMLNVRRVRKQWVTEDYEAFQSLVGDNSIFTPDAWPQETNDFFASRFVGASIPNRARKLLNRFGVTAQKDDKGKIIIKDKGRNKKGSEDTRPWFCVNATEEALKEQRVNPKNLGLYITQAKSQYLSPSACVEREQLNNPEEAPSLFIAGYGAYQFLLGAENSMDHDDTLIEAVSALTDNAALTKVRSRFKHILVDEAQDLNNVQRDMFGLILGTHKIGDKGLPEKNETPEQGQKTITYIGDPKQTIYGFRGARETEFVTEALEAAEAADVENKELFTLGQNYRSGKNIVKAANRLLTERIHADKLKQLGGLCFVGLEAEEGDIKLKKAETVAEATKDFADEILAAKATEGFKFNQFGVACRTNKEVIPYALALFQKGIPYRSGVDPFEHKACKIILNAMNLAHKDNLERMKAIKATASLLGYKEIAKDAYSVLQTMDRNSAQDFYDALLKRFTSPEETAFINACKAIRTSSELTSISDIYNLVMGYSTDTTNSPKSADGKLIYTYAFAAVEVKTEEAEEGTENTDSSEASQGDSNDGKAEDNSAEEKQEERASSNPVAILTRIFNEGLSEDSKYPSKQSAINQLDYILSKVNETRANAKRSLEDFTQKELNGMVTLDTVHGWKGLECDNLYVPMLPTWPSDKVNKPTSLLMPPKADGNAVSQQEKAAAAQEEETRLAYVALTRGKKKVRVVTYSKKEVILKNGQVVLKNFTQDNKQSPFIAALGLCEEDSDDTDLDTTTDTQTTSKTASGEDISDDLWLEMVELGVVEGGF